MKSSKLHKSLNFLFRFLIVALSLGFIYWKVFYTGETDHLLSSVRAIFKDPRFLGGTIVLIILMALNWSVEAIKWKFIIEKVEGLNFIQALQSVLSGVTVSIFTPNRTGEFIGRAFILKRTNPLTAVLLTFLASLSQLLITVILGALGLLLALPLFLSPHQPDIWTIIGFAIGILVFNTILILLYLNIPSMFDFLNGRLGNRLSKWAKYMEALRSTSYKELIRLLILSLLRYGIFSFQFYLILKISGIDLGFDAFWLIPVIYLVLTLIPTFALSELGIRGTVSLFIIGLYFQHNQGTSLTEAESLAVVLAAGLLWVINLAVPALLGIPFVFKLRFFRKWQD